MNTNIIILFALIDSLVMSWEGKTLIEVLDVKDIYKLTGEQQMYMGAHMVGLHKTYSGDSIVNYKNKYGGMWVWFGIKNDRVKLTFTNDRIGFSCSGKNIWEQDITELVLGQEDLV